MSVNLSDVYVPRAPEAAESTSDGGEATTGTRPPWPPAVYRPEAGDEPLGTELAARVAEVLPGRAELSGRGHAGVAALFGAPDVARSVVHRLVDEARGLACTAVAAVRSGGLLVAAPVAVRAGLPLAVLRGAPEAGAGGEPRRASSSGSGGDGVRPVSGSLGPGDRVLVVDDVVASGATLEAAVTAVEDTGAAVVASAVVVRLEEEEAGTRVRNILYVLSL